MSKELPDKLEAIANGEYDYYLQAVIAQQAEQIAELEQEIEPLNKTIEGLKHQIANDPEHIHSCMMCNIFERQACREQHKGLEQEIKGLREQL